MVTYLVEPAPEGADDKRVHKYPYMACEVGKANAQQRPSRCMRPRFVWFLEVTSACIP